MKTLNLVAVAFVLAISSHSSIAANLLVNGSFEDGNFTGWTNIKDYSLNGTEVSGSEAINSAAGNQTQGKYSAELDPNSTGNPAEIAQTFSTVSGSTYILQYSFKTLDPNDNMGFPQLNVNVCYGGSGNLSSGTDTLVSESVQTPTDGGSLSGQFATQTQVFTATSPLTTVAFQGTDQIIVDNVSVTAGVLPAGAAQQGAYSGTETATTSFPGQVTSSHTESISARITASGGLYLIAQPDSTTSLNGILLSGTTIVESGGGPAIPAAMTSTSLSFTVKYLTSFGGPGRQGNYSVEAVPATETDTYSLERTGN